MQEHHAIQAFAALAQEHRLQVFRLLLQQAPQGLAAGQLAVQVGVPASTMSSHLAHLERAGLIRSWREQRHIMYATHIGDSRTRRRCRAVRRSNGLLRRPGVLKNSRTISLWVWPPKTMLSRRSRHGTCGNT